MKNFSVIAALLIFILISPSSGKAGEASDPSTDVYDVCVEQYCHVFCPAGDISLCFCISKNGQPLEAPPSDVLLKIECNQNDLLYLCAGESLEKEAYLSDPSCVEEPGCGTAYCWYFRLGGYCEEARISLRMKGESQPFFQFWFPIRSPDINGDGVVDSADESILTAAYGTNTVKCDLNCDLNVDDSDLDILTGHLYHSCENQIGTDESTWGSIKSVYK